MAEEAQEVASAVEEQGVANVKGGNNHVHESGNDKVDEMLNVRKRKRATSGDADNDRDNDSDNDRDRGSKHRRREGESSLNPQRAQRAQSAQSAHLSQRESWNNLKRRIRDLILSVDSENVAGVAVQLFSKCNLVRGRGLVASEIIRSSEQGKSKAPILAALTAIINSRIPEIGELMLSRCIHEWQRTWHERGQQRHWRRIIATLTYFICHLVNQQVAHEIIILQILSMLVKEASNYSIDLVVGAVAECGQMLSKISPPPRPLSPFEGVVHLAGGQLRHSSTLHLL